MSFNSTKLNTYPVLPGVYLMKNDKGDVLYIGKANNIRQRVKQYFTSSGDTREMIPFLLQKVVSIDTIVVNSEKEALLLENTLIKQHKPKYNALLKDDKTYVALKVTNKSRWPTVQLVRYHGKPKPDGLFFGPYTSAHAARQTLDIIQKLFPLRQCSDQEFARRTRPCLLYDMKRCIAPCVGRCTKEEYEVQVDRTIKFLRGQDTEVLKDLSEEMERCAEALDFEKAGTLLKVIRQIERTLEGQRVDKPLGGDMDALAIFRQSEEVVLSKLIFRNGKLVGAHQFNFVNIVEEDTELLESFILQHYQLEEELPQEILIPAELSDHEALEEILSSGRSRKVYVMTPQRGDKKALVEMAYVNAEATFKKDKDIQSIRERTLMEMQEKFHLSKYPKRIECFDNSSHAGTEMVSAMVVFTEGAKDAGRYRRYKLKTVEGPDDYASMKEVLTRRYTKARDENDLPDLVVIDGGKGHLNLALQVFKDLNVVTVDVIGVAKEEGRHDKGMTAERVFLPNVKDPVFLRSTSPILFLLQQIRDEAHRFAIVFHRKLRSKKVVGSELDNVPGIGPVKRKKLLVRFGSVKGLKEASAEEIRGLKGISDRDVEAIKKHFGK